MKIDMIDFSLEHAALFQDSAQQGLVRRHKDEVAGYSVTVGGEIVACVGVITTMLGREVWSMLGEVVKERPREFIRLFRDMLDINARAYGNDLYVHFPAGHRRQRRFAELVGFEYTMTLGTPLGVLEQYKYREES
ncbi:MAG: hypothetical protein ACE5HA_03290 [Anaerolineae bacterium]